MSNYNENFRFQLGKGLTDGRKSDCPYCNHRRCFVRYIDTQGNYQFPDFVGRCDRENNCGANYTPQQFFRDHPDEKQKAFGILPMKNYIKTLNHSKPKLMQQSINRSPSPPSFIDDALVQRTLCHYDINPLFAYLKSVFGDKEALLLMQRYRVGTSRLWGGATVFWQTDICGHVRSGKIMAYDPKTGHRIKDGTVKVCWVHAALRLADFNLQQCLFGEHLLSKYPDRQVMIVESEKTAMICHYFMPDYVWIATGGKHGCFNSEAMQVLHGRDVTLFPDLGAFDEWDNKASLLRDFCHSVYVSRYLEQVATDEQRSQGLDMADFLLMTDTPQMILQRMIAINPALQMLIDKLQLEIVEE